jgi:hypothetical protein
MVGDGVLVKDCCCGKPNWGCCDGVCERERERVAPVESRFWGIDDMGYERAPFICCGFAIALGSMKLEGSKPMPFWGDWKSMVRGYGERLRVVAGGGERESDHVGVESDEESARECIQST